MSNNFDKADGTEFVGIITPEDGTHRVECFLRKPAEAPGFPSDIKPIHNNSDLPTFPPLSLENAIKIITEHAYSYGYNPDEIIWEDS